MTRRTPQTLLFSLAAVALGGLAWANRRLFTVHDITTGESAAYPELRSRVYYADPAAVLTAAAQAISALPQWRIVHVDHPNLALDAEAPAPLGGFPHAITLYLNPLGGGQTRVIIHAHSRHRAGDLGQNAARIRHLQTALDARLTRGAAF